MIKNSGIYGLFDHDELIYIGESKNMFARIGAHINNEALPFNDLRMYLFESEDYIRRDVEAQLIHKFTPPYNKKHNNEFAKGQESVPQVNRKDFEIECQIAHAQVAPYNLLFTLGYESAADFREWWEKTGKKCNAKTSMGKVYRELCKALDGKKRKRW